MMPSGFNPTVLVARLTRWLQARFPQRPIKGLARFSILASRWLPPYVGVIQLENGIRMRMDSQQPAERWLLYAGNYQQAVTRALKQFTHPGAYCLDIGANLGFYTTHLAHWAGSTGQVAAFEANPAMVDRITDNVALNQFSQVTVVSAAVNDRPGTLEFYISPSPGKSSVHAIDNATNKITVPAITIDDYMVEQHWTRLDVIKMDIEGNDCQALLGGVKTLTQFRPFLIFEYKISTPAPVAQKAFALLASLDYQIWSLSPGGNRTAFTWQPSGMTNTDIMCIPNGS